LSKSDIESLEDLVRKSAGFNAQRGDQVVVTNMPFQKADAEEIEGATLTETVATISPILKYIGIFAVVAFIVMFIQRPMLQSVMRGAPVRPLAEARAGAGAAGAQEYARQAAEAMRPSASDRSMNETDLAREMAKADAKQFADILRNWMK
jgi:flagellar M-ring protein FliF